MNKRFFLGFFVLIVMISSVYGAFPDNVDAVFDMEESSGNLADEINAWTGTVSGSPTYSQTGKNNNAIKWVDNSYADVSNLAHGYANFTISFWYKTPSDSEAHYLWGNKNSGTSRAWIYFRDDNRFYYRLDDVDDATVFPVTVYNDNQWYHIVLRKNSTHATLFIDGTESATAYSGALDISSGGNVRIGGCVAESDEADGEIDEFYQWDEALSGDVIVNDLYNGGTGGFYSAPAAGGGGKTINVTTAYPLNDTQYNYANINFNTTANATNDFYCDLNLDSILNTSTNYSAGTSVYINFTETLSDGTHNFNITCKDTTSGNVSASTTNTFFIDTLNPIISFTTPSAANNSIMENILNNNITITDNNLYSYYHNISLSNGTVIYSVQNTSLTGLTSFTIGNSSNLTGYYGLLDVNLRVCDGHTKNEIGDYDIIKTKDSLTFEGIEIISVGASSSGYEKLTDRYSFSFDYTLPKTQITVEVPEYCKYIGDKSGYAGHFVCKDTYWIDFEGDYERVEVNGNLVTVTSSEPIEKWSFNSIGELNCVEKTAKVWNYQSNVIGLDNVLTRQNVLFQLNLSQYNSSIMTPNYANFTFNNTLYTATGAAVGNDYIYNVTVQMPLITTQTNITGIWNYSINNIFPSETATTSMIYIPAIDNCSTYTARFINASMKDEESDALLTNSTISFAFSSWINDYSFSYSDSMTNINPYPFCIYPSWASFNTNLTFDYAASVGAFTSRSYINNSVTANNVTFLLDLFLLSDPTEITFHVIDRNDNDIENVLIEAYKYDIATGTDTLVESQTTDSNGNVIFGLRRGTTQYSFKFYQGGVLKIATNRFKLFDTLYEYVIGDVQSTRLQEWLNLQSITSSLTYSNNTRNVLFTWTDSNQIANNYCLNLTNLNTSTEITNCTTSNTGSLTLSLPSFNVSYYAEGLAKYNGTNNWYTIETLSIDGRSGFIDWFGTGTALMFGLIIFIVIGMLSLVNKNMAVAGAGFAAIILYLFGILPSFTAMMGIICLCVMILIIINKRFD